MYFKMTREEIVKAAKNHSMNEFDNDNRFAITYYQSMLNCKNDFIAGAKFYERTQLERKKQAYIDRIGYEPESKHLEDWNLQIDLLNKKIEEL